MKDPIDYYWKKRIEKCKEASEGNNFKVYTAGSKEEVKNLILGEIFPKLHFESVSWGDSMSMLSTEIM
jgi:hypothetical protein